MHSSAKHRTCLRCGAQASSSIEADFKHGILHAFQHGVKHPSPLAIGVGLFFAGFQVLKELHYTCSGCKHEFFSW